MKREIKAGQIYKNPCNSISVVLKYGYNHSNEEPLYYIGGVDSNPFEPYSNLPFGATIEEITEYLKNHEYLGELETNFFTYVSRYS